MLNHHQRGSWDLQQLDRLRLMILAELERGAVDWVRVVINLREWQ